MKKWSIWALPFLWMGVIFYSSAQPYEKQDVKPFMSDFVDLSFLIPYVHHIEFTYKQDPISVDALGIYGFVEFFIRKGAHVTVFFVLCMLFYMAMKRTIVVKPLYISLFALLATVSYAIFDEIHQGWTPNRTPYIGDVFLDTAGGLLAIIFILFCQRKKRKR
ncbi:VanZ family protein [Salirhabdus salicampi]|uniref:VanZ family protein n=1 Tax=Salirhabdus salicampi TaxID=476102 RepID=UPI0020C50C96|nr:VanZ family protein [Salirhabdus salicampi]MCP8617588.1 VanZ family protein [Salirhabdus salicampi]